MEENPILTAQQMRKVFLPQQLARNCEHQTQYYQFLTNKGLIVNPKVALSVFHLKNGLPFIGMSANESIDAGEILIRVPEELILSSAKAAQEPLLKEVFQDQFFIGKYQTWQDRTIIVYCMYLLHQKDQNNPWYQMICNFPKQCDIASFWPQEELNTFKDLTMISAAALDLKSFEQQWSLFLQCQKLYPILQQKEYNLENYKNIFINLTNRSFGKNLSFISMVPFAQFFNHHCSKVYYMSEKQRKTQLKDEDMPDDQSSIGSYESNQYIEEGQFKYDSVEIVLQNWSIDESYDLIKEEAENIKAEVIRIANLLENQLNWQDFTILFVGHLIYKLKIIERQYLARRKPYQRTQFQLKIVENSFENYKNKVIEYYQTTKKKNYYKLKEDKKVHSMQNFFYPTYKKQYENLVLKTSKFDKFQAKNQIFFRYGRNSNRSLLLRYGFAIQGNKYEHVWVSFSIIQCVQDFPDILSKVMSKNLSLLRKFKIHHHILNMDLIIFFRLNSWSFYHEQAVNQIFQVIDIQKQIIILQQIISILEGNVDMYDGKYDLTDKTLTYHQYFIAVYHKEKLSIINKQIAMLRKIIDVLNAISQGQTKKEAINKLSKSQKKILDYYIESIQVQ